MKPCSDSLSNKNQDVPDAEADLTYPVATIGSVKEKFSWFSENHSLFRRLRLLALAGLILGWWISSTALRATRHRWIVQTFFAWSFIAIIAFRFIPTSVVSRPIEAAWIPIVQEPFFALPKHVRYGLGWLALLAIVLGSAFGNKVENVRSLIKPLFFFWKAKCLILP